MSKSFKKYALLPPIELTTNTNDNLLQLTYKGQKTTSPKIANKIETNINPYSTATLHINQLEITHNIAHEIRKVSTSQEIRKYYMEKLKMER